MTAGTWPSLALWHVTTEGDCEGRTTRDLGVHFGQLDDIAFALSGSSCYKLQFDLVDPKDWARNSPKTEVFVGLGIESKTWDLRGEALADYFRRMLDGRDVAVQIGNYHASVKLVRDADPECQEMARRDALRAAALAKLTPEELEALTGATP